MSQTEWGDNEKNFNVTIHRTQYEVCNDEISANATAFTANEPRYGENSGNICV